MDNSLPYGVIDNFYERVKSEWESHLKQYVITQLKKLGYDFSNDHELEYFLLKRVTRVQVSDNEYHLYLDYRNAMHTGTLFGIYSDEVKLEYDLRTFKIGIG